jgi:hypothetical protein
MARRAEVACNVERCQPPGRIQQQIALMEQAGVPVIIV